MDTVARGQRSLGAAERFIERFIERRSQKGESTRDEHEEAWKLSLAAHNERRRRQRVAEWFGFYCRMADSHARLSEEYAQRAEGLCEEDGGRGLLR